MDGPELIEDFERHAGRAPRVPLPAPAAPAVPRRRWLPRKNVEGVDNFFERGQVVRNRLRFAEGFGRYPAPGGVPLILLGRIDRKINNRYHTKGVDTNAIICYWQ